MKRTLLKTLTYAVMHFLVAISVTFVLTGDWRLALAVGVIEPLVQTLAFMVHERLWSKADASPEAPCSHTALATALMAEASHEPQDRRPNPTPHAPG